MSKVQEFTESGARRANATYDPQHQGDLPLRERGTGKSGGCLH